MGRKKPKLTRRQRRKVAAAEREAAVELRIVCQMCSLEQSYREFNDEITPCARGEMLDLPCPGEYAITVEAYLDGFW